MNRAIVPGARAHPRAASPALRATRSLGIARCCGGCSSGGSSCPGDERRHDVGRVSIETASGAVVAHRRSLIGVRCGFLHVSQWDAGIERGGDERMPEAVR